MTVGRILSPKTNQPEHDMVFTPPALAQRIIGHFNPAGIVLDPSRGGGAFYDNFPTGVDRRWCELTEGVDFLEYGEKVDWVMTNPPWSKIRTFLQKGVEISDNIVFLITINHIMTKARMRLIYDNDFGIKEIYGVPTPRENWPQSGFQLGAVHLQRGHRGGSMFTGVFGA